jgi:hypothetical protein
MTAEILPCSCPLHATSSGKRRQSRLRNRRAIFRFSLDSCAIRRRSATSRPRRLTTSFLSVNRRLLVRVQAGEQPLAILQVSVGPEMFRRSAVRIAGLEH